MSHWTRFLIVLVVSLLGFQVEAKVPTITIIFMQTTEDVWQLTHELDEPIDLLALSNQTER